MPPHRLSQARASLLVTSAGSRSSMSDLSNMDVPTWFQALEGNDRLRLPDILTLLRRVFLVKGGSGGPRDHRPIHIVSALYGLWQSVQWTKQEAWSETWMTKDMHGARRGCACQEVLFAVLLQQEKQELVDGFFGGIASDQVKCFDRFLHNLSETLMRAYGLDENFLRLPMDWAQRLAVQSEFGRERGTFFWPSNGFSQEHTGRSMCA